MRKWIFTLILLALFLPLTWQTSAAQTPYPAPQATPQATGEVSFSSLEVDLWPEYDRPAVLVIYHLFLAQGTSLPADLALRIPAAGGDPYNVAYRDTDGLLYNIAYNRSIEGPWATIHFTTPTNEVQFEYYDPALQKNGAARTYSYQWPGDYAVTSLAIQVQQPLNATSMQITPALGSPLPGDSNLMYYKAIVGSAAKGNTFSVSFSYQKPDDTLSVQSLKVQPASPINDQTQGRQTLSQVFPWLLGAAGLLLIAGGGWWYWQSGRSTISSQINKRRSSSPPKVEPEPESLAADSGDIYCHQCGKRAAPGDIFCRACGTRLRRGE